jgi:hypothetical protein
MSGDPGHVRIEWMIPERPRRAVASMPGGTHPRTLGSQNRSPRPRPPRCGPPAAASAPPQSRREPTSSHSPVPAPAHCRNRAGSREPCPPTARMGPPPTPPPRRRRPRRWGSGQSCASGGPKGVSRGRRIATAGDARAQSSAGRRRRGRSLLGREQP